MKRVSTLVLLAALPAACLPGCAELNRTVYSRSLVGETRAMPGVMTVTFPSATTTISLEAADLQVKPYNTRMAMSLVFPLLLIPLPFPGSSCETGKFHICLEVRPKTAGISFDPSQVFIHTAVGSFAPDGVLRTSGCSDHPDDKAMPTLPAIATAVIEPAWFDLRFPLPPPSPETPFALDLKGISAGDQAVQTPYLRFEKASRWSYHLIPLFR